MIYLRFALATVDSDQTCTGDLAYLPTEPFADYGPRSDQGAQAIGRPACIRCNRFRL